MSKKGGLGKGMKALINSGDRDIKKAVEEAEKNGLAFVHYKEKNRWAEVKFI